MGLNQTKTLLHNIRNNQNKRPMYWEDIFANYEYDKGLIFKINNEFIWLDSKKISNTIKNGQMT